LLSQEDQKRVYSEVVDLTKGPTDFYVFILFSSLIATLGLLINSAAVIIGAMIVAPLMNPILVVSMGVVRGNLNIIKEGAKHLLLGTMGALAISYIILIPIPEIKLTAEIMARTQPNLYDLIVALTAGAAGAYATGKSKMFLSLPGVAIAVALMPPLTTTGIGLYLQNPSVYLGSFLLFLTNLGGINLGAILIFLLFGFAKHGEENKTQFLRHFKFSVLLVIMLCIPLVYMTGSVIYKSKVENIIRSTVVTYLEVVIPGAELDTLNWHQEKEEIVIKVIVNSQEVPAKEFAGSLKSTFEENLETPVIFTLEVVPVQIIKVQ